MLQIVPCVVTCDQSVPSKMQSNAFCDLQIKLPDCLYGSVGNTELEIANQIVQGAKTTVKRVFERVEKMELFLVCVAGTYQERVDDSKVRHTIVIGLQREGQTINTSHCALL